MICSAAQARHGAQLFRDFLFKAMDAMDAVRDPERYAAKMFEYATTRDPEVVTLLQRIEQASRDGREAGAQDADGCNKDGGMSRF